MERGSPRLAMTLLLTLAGLGGLLTSVLLREAGLASMAVRYPIALLVAYGAFLLLVRSWARRTVHGGRAWRPGPADVVDLTDIAANLTSFVAEGPAPPLPAGPSFGGGSFGGGGVGGSFDAPSALSSMGDGVGSGAADGVASAAGEAVGSSDDAWPLVFVLVVLALGFLAVGVTIWMAPTLLAEALLDVTLVAGMARGVRRVAAGGWPSRLLARTWILAAALALLLSASGWVMQSAAPEADSIGQFFAAMRCDGDSPGT